MAPTGSMGAVGRPMDPVRVLRQHAGAALTETRIVLRAETPRQPLR